MQFPQLLIFVKMYGARSTMLLFGIGDFLAGMSVISFSLDRRSGEVGYTENVRLSQVILEGSFL